VTTSPSSKPLSFESIDDVIRLLRDSGHRISASRRLVLEALFEADGPVSAQHIASGLGGLRPRAEPTSVYRTLEQLEELGVVRHVHIGHGPGLYALVGDGERAYLACERCGRVTIVRPAELDSVRRAIRRKFGYDARFSHFPILGLCRSCSQESRSGEGAAKADGGTSDHGEQDEHEHSHGDYIHSHPHAQGEHEHVHD